jgi:DNA-directed RNA polymerase subunit L
MLFAETKTLLTELFAVDDLGNVYRKNNPTKAVGSPLPRGYKTIGIRHKGESYTLYAHRIVWLLNNDCERIPAGYTIDHKDNDPTNNHPSNLQLATARQNNQKRKIRSDNTTGLKGVSPTKRFFQANIYPDGEKVYLGLFQTAEEAHAAYCVAALKFYGEFAKFH